MMMCGSKRGVPPGTAGWGRDAPLALRHGLSARTCRAPGGFMSGVGAPHLVGRLPARARADAPVTAGSTRSLPPGA